MLAKVKSSLREIECTEMPVVLFLYEMLLKAA